MAYTPGPWKQKKADWFLSSRTGMGWRYIPIRAKGQDWDIAHVFVDEDDPEMVDNARLIAAAPRLMAALKTARDVLAYLERWRDLDATDVDECIASHGIRAIDVAIAKAEGRVEV